MKNLSENLRWDFGICMEGLRKVTKTSIRIVRLSAEI
jgi:hypothetical protein